MSLDHEGNKRDLSASVVFWRLLEKTTVMLWLVLLCFVDYAVSIQVHYLYNGSCTYAQGI